MSSIRDLEKIEFNQYGHKIKVDIGHLIEMTPKIKMSILMNLKEIDQVLDDVLRYSDQENLNIEYAQRKMKSIKGFLSQIDGFYEIGDKLEVTN